MIKWLKQTQVEPVKVIRRLLIRRCGACGDSLYLWQHCQCPHLPGRKIEAGEHH